MVIPLLTAPKALLAVETADPLLPDTIWNILPASQYVIVVVSKLLSVNVIDLEAEVLAHSHVRCFSRNTQASC